MLKQVNYGQFIHRSEMSRNLRIAMRAFDRDIAAAKAATMFRKGASVLEVREALRMSETALRELAHEYGFRFPPVINSMWPTPNDPGELGQVQSAYDNWQRSVVGARRTLEGRV